MITHEEIGAAIERLRAIEPVGYAPTVAKVVLGFMDNIVSALELRDALIALLEQADPDTHMELPVDANGVPIHIGDKVVEHEDGHDFVIDGYEYDGKWWVFHTDGIRAPAYMCTHYSAKELLMKFGCLYNSINCDEIPALVEEYAEKLKEVMADEVH